MTSPSFQLTYIACSPHSSGASTSFTSSFTRRSEVIGPSQISFPLRLIAMIAPCSQQPLQLRNCTETQCTTLDE
jgi:hypothetical protein